MDGGINGNELLGFARLLGKEKGWEPEDVLTSIIQPSLVMALRRSGDGEVRDAEFRVSVNPLSGEISTQRRWRVLADDEAMENSQAEIMTDDPLAAAAGAEAGEYVEDHYPNDEEVMALLHAAQQDAEERGTDKGTAIESPPPVGRERPQTRLARELEITGPRARVLCEAEIDCAEKALLAGREKIAEVSGLGEKAVDALMARSLQVSRARALLARFNRRTVVQVAKQNIRQRQREKEHRENLLDLLGREEDVVSGQVQRVDRHSGDAILEIMRVECLLPKYEMLGGGRYEAFKVGERIQALVRGVRVDGKIWDLEGMDNDDGDDGEPGWGARRWAGERCAPGRRLEWARRIITSAPNEGRGPQLVLTRRSPLFLVRLFQRQVPEIEKGILEIIGAARDSGNRAKICVRSHDARVDPVGTCVGIRGSRVQTVTNELNNERIDIIPWDKNDVKFVMDALAPARISDMEMDEDKRSVDVVVEQENLAQAIGRGGVNVRLASELTGWRVNLFTPEERNEKKREEKESVCARLASDLDITADMADILYEEGFDNIELIAKTERAELLEVEGLDEEKVDELRRRADEQLAKREKELSEKMTKQGEDLRQFAGMNEAMLRKLAENDIFTLEEFAYCDTEEVKEFFGWDGARDAVAADLITRAREASWPSAAQEQKT